MGLVNTCGDAYFVFAGMGWVYSKHVEMHFLSLFALDRFIEHILRSRLNGMDLVKTS